MVNLYSKDSLKVIGSGVGVMPGKAVPPSQSPRVSTATEKRTGLL